MNYLARRESMRVRNSAVTFPYSEFLLRKTIRTAKHTFSILEFEFDR